MATSLLQLLLLPLALFSCLPPRVAATGPEGADGGCAAGADEACGAPGVEDVEDLSALQLRGGASGGSEACMVYTVPYFVPYYNYNGPLLEVTGTMKVETFRGRIQKVQWSLYGVDGNCGTTPLPNGPVSNDCGIHIHKGTSCDGDALGHFFDTAVDPWEAVHYKASASGGRSAQQVKVRTDLSSSDIQGHAMIVHDLNGGRIACGLIGEPRPADAKVLTATGFVKYFNYAGPLEVSGTIEVAFYSGASEYQGSNEAYQVIDWGLRGVDGNCGAGTQYPNGALSNDCGIHIHEGDSCDGDAFGHFHNIAEDPWKAVHYLASSGKKRVVSAEKGVQVVTGLTFEDAEGKAIIVHDVSGGRIACAILTAA